MVWDVGCERLFVSIMLWEGASVMEGVGDPAPTALACLLLPASLGVRVDFLQGTSALCCCV